MARDSLLDIAEQDALADDADAILRRLEGTLKLYTRKAGELDTEWRGRKMPDLIWNEHQKYMAGIVNLAEQLQALSAVREHYRAGSDVVVRSEPDIYGPGSGNSFYKDFVTSQIPELASSENERKAAEERQRRHNQHEARTNPTAAAAGRNTANRATEQRAMSSAATSGGSFQTPIYDVGDYAPWTNYPPNVLQNCTKVTDPGYGLELRVPIWDSASSVEEQENENSGVADESFGGAYVSTALVTVAGEVEVSQQLFDRSGPGGVTSDQAITAQLLTDYWATCDEYCIQQILAVGTPITGHATFAADTFYDDVANAQQSVATGGGARLPASHIFSADDLQAWLLSRSDTNGRPLTLPWIASPPSNANEGFSGYTLLGSGVWHDSNIPINSDGVTTPLVFANIAEVFVLRTDPVLSAVPAPYAVSLSTIVQAYSYLAVLVRHSSAIAVLDAPYLLANPSYS